MFNEANIDYALRSKASNGNMDEAFRLLLLFEDTYEGLVKAYNPNTKLLGAENRCAVTCYLDALLFAMFARLDSFEAMLYHAFEDPPRKKLVGLLRLWVNMLRDGKLITTDIVSCMSHLYSCYKTNIGTDQDLTRCPCRMWVGIGREIDTTRHVRSLHIYYWQARLTLVNPQDGPLSYRKRRARR